MYRRRRLTILPVRIRTRRGTGEYWGLVRIDPQQCLAESRVQEIPPLEFQERCLLSLPSWWRFGLALPPPETCPHHAEPDLDTASQQPTWASRTARRFYLIPAPLAICVSSGLLCVAKNPKKQIGPMENPKRRARHLAAAALERAASCCRHARREARTGSVSATAVLRPRCCHRRSRA